MKRLIAWINAMWAKVAGKDSTTDALSKALQEVKALGASYEQKMKSAPVIYTTIRSFHSKEGDKLFWGWAHSVLISDEWRYLMFSMRENVIRDLVMTSDPAAMKEANGQLKMLQQLDNYLTQGLTQYANMQKQD